MTLFNPPYPDGPGLEKLLCPILRSEPGHIWPCGSWKGCATEQKRERWNKERGMKGPQTVSSSLALFGPGVSPRCPVHHHHHHHHGFLSKEGSRLEREGKGVVVVVGWGGALGVLKKKNNDANSTRSWKMTCGCTGWKPVKKMSETMRSCGEPHTTSPPHNRLSSFVALGWFVFGSKRLIFFSLLLPL